jgi:hypothetical protein
MLAAGTRRANDLASFTSPLNAISPPAKVHSMWKCPKCGSPSEDQFDACWNCTEPRNTSEAASPSGAGPDDPARPEWASTFGPGRTRLPAKTDHPAWFGFGLLLAGGTVVLALEPRVVGRDQSELYLWPLIRLGLLLICFILGVSGCVLLIMDRKELRPRTLGLGLALYAIAPLVIIATLAYYVMLHR